MKRDPSDFDQGFLHAEDRPVAGENKWILVSVGAVALVVFAVLYVTFDPARRREAQAASEAAGSFQDRYSPAMVRLRNAQRAGPQGLKEIQSLMTDPDLEVAKLATMRLALRGDEGWKLIFERLSQCDPSLIEAVQTTNFGDAVYIAGAKALRSGSEVEAEAALLALDRHSYYGSVAGERALRQSVFEALVGHAPKVEEADVESFTDVIAHYGPLDPASLIELLDSRSDTLRLVAATACGKLACQKALPKLRSMADDPDPKVRQAAQLAESRIEESARQEARVNGVRVIPPPDVDVTGGKPPRKGGYTTAPGGVAD